MDCLKELGTSVYLRWSNEHLARRITLSGTEQRPVLQNRQGRELLDFVAWQMSGREPYYAQADYIVDAPLQGGLAEENDEQIADHLYHYILSRL